MSISQEIRDAVRAARTAAETQPNDPFKQILDEVAQGLTDDTLEARLTAAPSGRWTLWIAPAYQPGRAVAMLEIVISAGSAEVWLDSKQVAATPTELAEILKKVVTTPAFLESLGEIATLSTQSVEGFLKMAPRTVSREDIMLDVPPDAQREIAGSVGNEVSLRLQISDFRGAGTFKGGTPYKVLESAGFSVTLSRDVTQDEDGALQIVGRVSRTVAP